MRPCIYRKAILFLLSTCALVPVSAELRKGMSAVGANSPGVFIKHSLSDRLALDVHAQFQTGASSLGLRQYLYVNPRSETFNFLIGLEEDVIAFDLDGIDGTGSAFELFVGGEYFIGRRLSFQMDIGPAYLHLKHKETETTEDGLEGVVNFSVNWYWRDTR